MLFLTSYLNVVLLGIASSVPDINDANSFNTGFNTFIQGANLSDETVKAGKNLDNVISTLIKKFGEGGNDYLKVLTNKLTDMVRYRVVVCYSL